MRKPLKIRIRPYFTDHRVEGKAVLPGVEAMQILADSARTEDRSHDFRVLEDVSFTKFLYLPPDESKQALFSDMILREDGSIVSKLVSVSKIGNITRTKEHAAIRFSHEEPRTGLSRIADRLETLSDAWTDISPVRIYEELVRFGPAYRNIIRLRICEQAALAHVRSGASEEIPLPLGSSFPLDAAFHAACVWGQRFCGFVGFPVGFEKRSIVNPAQPGCVYISAVIPVQRSSTRFTADIRIQDETGIVYEDITGVRMKDVSGGRLTPPQWLFTQEKGNRRIC